MIRVVFDTVVFVRALLNPRSIWGRLVFQHSNDYRLFVSRPVLVEILEVLRRPELVQRFGRLPGPGEVLALLAQAEVVEMSEIPAVCRDPNDDKFLATAARCAADVLVTE